MPLYQRLSHLTIEKTALTIEKTALTIEKKYKNVSNIIFMI